MNLAPGIAVPEGRRPKETFVFTKGKIETTIARTCKSFIFLDSSAAIVSLNSLYWFAEYLEGTGSITEERSAMIKKWCIDLYNEVFPRLVRTDLSVKAFERFPV